jgi:hypothetical protein
MLSVPALRQSYVNSSRSNDKSGQPGSRRCLRLSIIICEWYVGQPVGIPRLHCCRLLVTEIHLSFERRDGSNHELTYTYDNVGISYIADWR